jgi:hypothetical protein
MWMLPWTQAPPSQESLPVNTRTFKLVTANDLKTSCQVLNLAAE